MFLKIITTALILLIISSSAQAISLTTHRIYMDNKNRTSSFLVLNRSQKSEDCKLSLRYFSFDEASIMGKELKETFPKNNGEKNIKFSPRRFTVPPGERQTIRFSFRKRSKDDIPEYHSYLSINCGQAAENKDPNKERVSLAPRLVHNVPVIARIRDLKAQASIDNVILDKGGKIKFRLNRKGERSIYGDVSVYDKTSGKRIAGLKALSIYVQSDYQDFKFSLPKNMILDDIMIRFIENKAFGGSLSITYNDEVL